MIAKINKRNGCTRATHHPPKTGHRGKKRRGTKGWLGGVKGSGNIRSWSRSSSPTSCWTISSAPALFRRNSLKEMGVKRNEIRKKNTHIHTHTRARGWANVVFAKDDVPSDAKWLKLKTLPLGCGKGEMMRGGGGGTGSGELRKKKKVR